MLACSTARDLQEWLHALGEIIPIETQGLPVPLLGEGQKTHTRHSTAPTRIDLNDEDLQEHQEGELRRRGSDDVKKSRPYLRRVSLNEQHVRASFSMPDRALHCPCFHKQAVSSGQMPSDREEIQEMVRKVGPALCD
jgi:hypothetical protein